MDDEAGGKRTLIIDLPDELSLPAGSDEDTLPLLQLDEPCGVTCRRELRDAVADALSRYAISGELEIHDDELRLATPRGVVSRDVHVELVRWDETDGSPRSQTANRLARQLASAMPPSRSPRERPFHIDRSTLGLAALAFTLAGTLFYFEFWGVHRSSWFTDEVRGPQQPMLPGVIPTIINPARHVEVCEATRSRVFRGGLVSMADAEGWVVELALVGGASPLIAHPALHDFFGLRREGYAEYQWKDETQLAFSSTAARQVQLETFLIATPEIHHGLTVTFSGSYVESYFDELTRPKFYHLAHSMAGALDAQYAALYARCSHDQIHALGSWFRGESAPGAATSLLYFLGTYAQPFHIFRRHLVPPDEVNLDRTFSFNAITKGTAHVDRAALSTLVGSEGGMATSDGEDAVIISFPFRDANRASRVSRTLARVTSMGD